jgi:hypothetical protein
MEIVYIQKKGGIAMKRTRPSKTIIIQTTVEMDNWMHPQTTERKQRIKDRRMAAAERFEKMRNKLPVTLDTEKVWDQLLWIHPIF